MIVRRPLTQGSNVLTTATHSTRERVSTVNTLKGKSMRDAAINLRALPEQRDLIDQAATLLGKQSRKYSS